MTAPSSPSSPRPLEALLAHREWVRAVARSVARDDALADDLEQDAWLAAARRPPRPGPGIRAWFAQVIRRRHHERHRGDARRDARDLASARPEAGLSTLSVVEEAEAHERVVHAVLALEEPWREAVLLRWFEGLPPRAIAERCGVPVETVRTRLKRAVELLRERLVGRRELRAGDWLLVLAAAATPRSPEGAASGGAALAAGVATKVGVAGAVALLLLVVVASVDAFRGEPEETPEVAEVSSESQAPRRRDRGSRAAVPTDDRRASLDAVPQEGSNAPAPATEAAAKRVGRISGRVVDTSGRPLAGVAVQVPDREGGGWVETGRDGRFVLQNVKPRERVPVWVLSASGRGERVTPVTVTAGEEATVGDVVVVTCPEVLVHGRAVSRTGAPLTGGSVHIPFWIDAALAQKLEDIDDPPLAALVVLSGPLPPSVQRWRAKSPLQADGSFEISVPALPEGVALTVQADGHIPAGTNRLALREGPPPPVLLELEPLPKARGIVVDSADGRPVAGAKVAFAGAHTSEFHATGVTTGEDGRFDVAVKESRGTSRRLSVVAPGHVDFTVNVPIDADELRVEVAPARTLRGRVVFPDGTPVAGVWVAPDHRPRHDGAGNQLRWGGATTDAEGAFTAESLWDGPWKFVVVPVAGTRTDFAPADVTTTVGAETSDLRIVVERSSSISGVVVDESGAAASGVYVFVQPTTTGPAPTIGAHAAEDGAFRISGVTGTCTILAGYGPGSGVLRTTVPGVAAGTRDLRIVVRRGLSIEGVVVDEDGRPVAGRKLQLLRVDEDPFLAHGTDVMDVTSAHGSFRISGFDGGTWRLVARYSPTDTREVLLGGESIEAGTKGLRLVLTAGASISGTLVDADGAPMPKRRVDALWTPKASGGQHAYTDAEGRFLLPGLPPGRAYTISSIHGRVPDVAAGTKDLLLAPPRR